MRNYLQMKQQVQRRIRNTTISTASADMGDWFEGAREWLMQYNWRCLRFTWTFVTVASQAEYGLTPLISDIRVVKFTTDIEKYLFPKDLQEIDLRDPNPSTTTYPNFYYLNGTRNVKNQPSSASVVTVSSDDASDDTQKIRITGLVGGIERTEELSLNGTTDVVGSLSFTEILYGPALDAVAVGVITATSNSAAVTLAELPPNKIAVDYTTLGLYLTPSTAGKTLTVRGDMELAVLVNDDDIWPAQVQQLGMQHVYARWLEYDGHQKAGPALAELFHPLSGRPGPMLSRALIKNMRELNRVHFIQGGRRGVSTQTLLLDGDFPPVW
ncbi:hypothetical protein LCGC14_0394090 [marine sediment metagenome]|uniref:Uncharacterized protein n=1 Tax=marine sediment metagenome TaxID=412755 RepID=A0A0F9T4G2_9ZZZZ